VGTKFEDEHASLYGELVAALLLKSTDWVRRRVENLRLEDDDTMLVSVSIDYELVSTEDGEIYRDLVDAEALPHILLPFALLSKRPLYGFSLRDDRGHPLPMLTREQTEPIAEQVLWSVATAAVQNRTLSDSVRDRVASIATGTALEARGVLQGLQTEARLNSSSEAAQLLSNNAFMYIARLLSEKFVALAVMGDEPHGRRILKYQYATPLGWKTPLAVRRVLSRFAVVSAVLDVDLPSVRLASSYHLEIRAPEQLEFRGVEIRKRAAGDRKWAKTDARVRGKSVLAHLMLQQDARAEPDRHRLRVLLAPQRRGFLRGALVSLVFSTLALYVSWKYQSQFSSTSPTSTSLLLIVPGLISAYLSRPVEHPAASRLYIGLRAGLALGGLACWTAAVLVVIGLPLCERLAWNWYLLVGSAAMTAVAALAYLSGTPRRGWWP
jgi:hypothetical protein